MSITTYPIYDCDHHYYEPADAFMRHLPKEYKRFFQYVQIDGRTKLAIDGVISDYIPNPTFERVADAGAHEGWYRGDNPEGLSLREFGGKPVASQAAFHSGAAHLKMMDDEGIHAAVLLPTLASIIEERMKHKPEIIQPLLHSLNLWVGDEYGFGNGRQFPTGAINLSDVDAACKELDFLIKAGIRSVLIRPAPVAGIRGGRSHGFPEFDPFWARINESKIFVIHHVSDSGYDQINRWWTAGASGATEWKAFDKEPFSEILDAMGRAISDSLTALVCHGVFDRFPDVRVAVMESGTAWLEPLLKRMEHTFHKMPKAFKRNPVETFRKHIFVAPFYEERLDKVAELIGANRVLFGSDWPHPEGLKHPVDFLKDIQDLTEADKKLVMHGNLKGLLEGVRD
jgi:predicted TIM-barrel fold metal-dependent hydrolase